MRTYHALTLAITIQFLMVSDGRAERLFSDQPTTQTAPSPSETATDDDAPTVSTQYGSAELTDCCATCGRPCRDCALFSDTCVRTCQDCQANQPWTLPQPCCLQRHKIKIGGWIQQGITFNRDHPNDTFNGPVATNDLDREYQMNQLWMFIDKSADNGGSGWALGGHIDIMYGTDWRFGINNGLENRINGFDRQTNGTVIPQMYMEVAYNKLSVKLGHFAAILDYETIPAPLNPLFSHSYSYGYSVPQLVTGALADYKLTKSLSVQAGFHRGWQQFEDNNDTLDFMGGVKYRSRNNRVSLAYALSTGAQDPAAMQDRFISSFVAQLKLTDSFKYVLVQNLGRENNATPAGQNAEWYGLNQYFLSTFNPRWTGVLRCEWFRDDDGVRIAGPGNIPGVRAWSGRGFAGNFYEMTAGLNWHPHPNVVVRPELRWDWYSGLAGPNGMLPFDDGTKDDQLLMAVDMIITF